MALALSAGAGCSLFHTRPVQEMSDTQSAMRAAKEVQADTLAPEIYREAADWWQRAKREYKLKNFAVASEFAEKARVLAEQAEFEAVRGGGVREEPPDPMDARPQPKYAPYPYPTPTGTPAEVYDQRRQEEGRGGGSAIQPAPAQTGLTPARP
jgi:hypothetical protein